MKRARMDSEPTGMMPANDAKPFRPALSVLIKSFTLLAIVTVLQLLGTRFGLVSAESDTGEHHYYRISIARCDAVVRINPDILYFGDSTVFPTTAYKDAGYTSDMLASLMPDRRVAGFHGVGLGPEYFADALDYFIRRGCQPDVVIVPINIRSLSTAFRHDSRYRYCETCWLVQYDGLWLRAFYRPIAESGRCNRHMLSESAYFEAMLTEALNEASFAAYKDSKGARTSLDDLRDFAFYGIGVRADNPGLEALRRMRDSCESVGAQLVCYITPVNFDNIEYWLGNGAARTAHANVQFAANWLNGHDIALLDLSNAVEADQFFVRSVPSSHLLAAGRHRVAERLCDYLRRLDSPSGSPASGAT